MGIKDVISSKRVLALLKVSVLVVVATIFYFQRWIFTYQYEPEYYENYYYHSQWNIPNSTRGISDGELYKFVGYRLVEGENPFYLNYEIPPLGKYLYGLAEKVVGNPYWVSTAMYLGSLGMVYWLLKQSFESEQTRWLGLLLFASTPFVGTQVSETMLDLPLMFFMLAYFVFYVRFIKNKDWLSLTLAGGCLGLATGVKPPIYTPLLGLIGLLVVLVHTKKITKGLWFALSLVGGYVVAFFMYFVRHPNPLPWIRLHQKSLDFYLGGTGTIDHLNQWKGIFVNTYSGWWNPGVTTGLGDWSLLLPVGVISLVVCLYWAINNKDWIWVMLSASGISFLAMNSLVPFWPRYLMPTIPLMVVATVRVLSRKPLILVLLIFANLLVLLPTLTDDDIGGNLGAHARFMSTRAYRELYRSIDSESRSEISESQFIEGVENFWTDIGTREVSAQIHLSEYEKGADKATAELELVGVTRHGIYKHMADLNYVKEREQWKIVWDWDYLYPDYDPSKKIDPKDINFEVEGGKSKVDGIEREVLVIPRLMYDWNAYLNRLSQITGESSLVADRQIKKVVPDDFPRFVGLVNPSLSISELKNLADLPGIKYYPEIQGLD